MGRKEIKYKSPSGFLYIGKNQPPFEEVKDGFGFYGVLMLDKKSDLVMCHICGKWYSHLSAHIFRSHNIRSDEYKEMFGLYYNTAMVSERIRLEMAERIIKMRKKNPEKFCSHGFKNGHKKQAGRRTPTSVALRNKRGRCDKQLIEKVRLCAKKIGHTPTLMELCKEYGFGFDRLIYRYLKMPYEKVCEEAGIMPVRNSNNGFTRKFVVKTLTDFYNKHHRFPITTDMKRGMSPYHESIIRAMGVNKYKEAQKIILQIINHKKSI